MFHQSLYSLNFRINFISKENYYFNYYLQRPIVALANNLVLVRVYYLLAQKINFLQGIFIVPNNLVGTFPSKIFDILLIICEGRSWPLQII